MDTTQAPVDENPEIERPVIRAHPGVVPQQDTLDTELTVRENLYTYGRHFDPPHGNAVPALTGLAPSSP